MRELVTLIRLAGNTLVCGVRPAEEVEEDEEEEETTARAGGTFTRQCVEDAHARELASHGSSFAAS